MNGLAMQTEGVDAAAGRVGRTGEQLAADWGAAKSAIAGSEGVIGTGRLADAFRQSYLPAADRTRADSDTFPPRFAALSDAGALSVRAYDSADTGSRDRLDGLGG